MVQLISILGLTTTTLAVTFSVRDTTCSPGSVTLNSRQCTIECGTDHPGGDYSALSVPDFQTCINTCSSDPNCRTAQYLTTNSYCYLKSLVGSSTSNADVNGIVCQSSASSSSTTTTTTTTSSATTSSCSPGPTTINGRTGAIECNTDRSGGDYSAVYAETFQACENACAADVSNCRPPDFQV